VSEITQAIAARQTQITQLQRDIETLQRAASIMGGTTKATPRATRQKATAQPKTKTKPTPKRKRKRQAMSAANKRAMSKRMKAYWAKRRKAKG